MFIVTRTTPTGTSKTYEARTRREIGKHVADVLYLNANVSKREATKAGMLAEKSSHVESHGYTFHIEQG